MAPRLPRVAVAAALVALTPVLPAVAFLGSDSSQDSSSSASPPRTLSTTYDCTNSFDGKVSELPVNADISATRTSTDGVTLAVSTGELDLDPGGQSRDVGLASRMELVVDGVPTTVTGSATVTTNATNPPHFPVATGTSTSTENSLTVTPGDLLVDITVSGFTLTLDCVAAGDVPTLEVSVSSAAPGSARG